MLLYCGHHRILRLGRVDRDLCRTVVAYRFCRLPLPGNLLRQARGLLGITARRQRRAWDIPEHLFQPGLVSRHRIGRQRLVDRRVIRRLHDLAAGAGFDGAHPLRAHDELLHLRQQAWLARCSTCRCLRSCAERVRGSGFKPQFGKRAGVAWRRGTNGLKAKPMEWMCGHGYFHKWIPTSEVPGWITGIIGSATSRFTPG